MEWLSHPCARSILIVALSLLIFVWYAYRQLRPYRVLRKALAASGHGGKQIAVGYFSQEDLAGGRVKARCAKPAMLVANSNGSIDVFVLTRWNACLHYQMPLATTGFEWFRSMLGGMLPPLLTVQQGRDDVQCPAVFEAPNTEYFAREIPRAGSSRAVAFSNSRPGQIWPIVIARGPQGGLWVLNAGNNLQYADLLIFDKWPLAARPRRVALDDGVDPISMWCATTTSW